MDRYQDIPIIKDLEGTRLYKTTKYPIIPRQNGDLYVITTEGDRYDVLARQYYDDSSLWWIISTANAEYPQNSLYPPIGIQLRIPANVDRIIKAYNNLNQ